MKSKITILLLALMAVNFATAQNPETPENGGEYVFNADQAPCLSNEARKSIIQTLENNVARLQSEQRLNYTGAHRDGHVLFSWPVQKADDVDYDDVWSISGYVDHNAAYPNQLTDYDCGTATYDTSAGYNHQGVDIFTWPFPWKLMDEDGAEIIAAADGQIIAKGNGQYDRSCNFNNNPWNAVYVQHSDGSVAWYGHMKNGSLTTKAVGDMVVQGEYLGIVGSSGNSTGPHLHFEVYEDDSYTQLIDPFAGDCNSLNGNDSWWLEQKPYLKPNINTVMTHSQVPDLFPTCPTTETTFESSEFDISDTIYFTAFLRDQVVDDVIYLKAIRPNGTYLYDWNITVATSGSAWYYYWSFPVDAVGEWTWEVTFKGQTETTNFTVSETLNLDESSFSQVSVYPNPFNDVLQITSKVPVTKAIVVDVLGKTMTRITNTSEGIQHINLETLSAGLYFLTLEGNDGQQKTIKLLKN